LWQASHFEGLSVAVTSIQIQNYQYHVFSSRDSTNGPSAVITLYDASNLLVAGLWFVKDPGALPTAQPPRPGPELKWNRQQPVPTGAHYEYRLAYSYADLPVIIDMLRNETPIFLIVDPTGNVVNWRISTFEEPVGEGEL
jgi:hypothetical protein